MPGESYGKQIEDSKLFSKLRLKKEPPSAGISKEGGASRHILNIKGPAPSAHHPSTFDIPCSVFDIPFFLSFFTYSN